MQTILTTTFTTLLTSLITYYLTRRKYLANVQGTEIDNVEKAVAIWRRMSEDLRTQRAADIETLRTEITTLQTENEALRAEITTLRTELETLRNKVLTLSHPSHL